MITITLKGIPKETHRELKRRAAAHGRSLNTEAIAVLESGVRSVPVEAEGIIQRARQFRNSLKFKVTAADLKRFKERRPRVIVADNSLLVYFWLPSDFAGLAEAAKGRDKVWASPILWRSEFRNVLAGYLRRKTLTEAEANAAYLNVQKDLGANEYSVPTERIIKLVLASDCPAYDCEYVALAQDLGVPLVTADKQVLRAFPKIAVSPEKFVK